MRQKFNIAIADIPMNISCEETEESINRAVTVLDEKMRALLSAAGHNCTKTEAALLLALDYCTRAEHAEEKIKELEDCAGKAEAPVNSFGASLLRGENETLRAELQVSRGTNDALLQDNVMLFRIHQKSEKQCAASNARTDRMHDEVLALMSEVQALRTQLQSLGVETSTSSHSSQVPAPIPAAELTAEETEVAHRYGQMDQDEILKNATGATPAAWQRGEPLQ